jgi:opacity protein-like surface antigen
LGGGLEYALSNHRTLIAEYEHIRLSDEGITLKAIDAKPGQPTELFHSDLEINLVKFGFNFKF